MHLFCPRFAQEVDYLAARRAAHYRVVDEHYSLILYGFAYRAELYSDLVDSLVLTGRDESSADIFVFYEAHSVGYSRRLGIAKSRVDSRIRDAHNNIGFDGMGL